MSLPFSWTHFLQGRVFVIAEAGVNHNGSLALAKALVDAAVAAKADAVKFQTFRAEALVSAAAPKAAYQKERTDASESQQAMLKRLELSPADHDALWAYCQQRGILFLSTPFDLPSIDLLKTIGGEGVAFFKIGSGELTNIPYLRAIGRTGKPVILSTGMATLDEIALALATLRAAGSPPDGIALLHANTAYPTPSADVQLGWISALAARFHVPVGYSDHTLGLEVSLAAVALGAKIIEKHLTLDATLPGPDQAVSLESDAFKALVAGVRSVELALGEPPETLVHKQPTASELANKALARKGIVAACPIAQGERFTEANLTTTRPEGATPASRWDEALSQTATRAYATGEAIELF